MQGIYPIIRPGNGTDRMVISKKQKQKTAVLLGVCLVTGMIRLRLNSPVL